MRRFTVAQPEAVETLLDKMRTSGKNNPDWYRLTRATGRAHERFQQVQTPDARSFYHGLLTGYAVALKALQGKIAAPRRR